MNTTPPRALRTLIIAAALLVPLAAAQAAPFGWLGGDNLTGSGHVARETRQPGRFHGVSLAVSGSVEVRTGGDETVTIEADDNLLPLIETVVEDGVLQIRPVKKNAQLDPRRLKVTVQARAIDSLGVAGSGAVRADRLRGDKVVLELAGSGLIDAGTIEAKSVSIEVAGSGNVRAAGAVDSLDVSLAGSGKADVGRLAAREVAANVSGSGVATVTARQSLAAAITGSGNIAYYGDPQLSRAITGSGTVRRLGDAR